MIFSRTKGLKNQEFAIFEKNKRKMLTTIEGIYENGRVIFDEIPPIKNRTKIFVTFLENETNHLKLKKRPFGTLKGTITVPNDFNEPLEDLKDYM
jgi:hypothetical protein